MIQLPKRMYHNLTKLLVKSHIGFRIRTLKHNNLLHLYILPSPYFNSITFILAESQDWTDLIILICFFYFGGLGHLLGFGPKIYKQHLPKNKKKTHQERKNKQKKGKK